MKKTLFVLLAVVMIFTAACTGGNNSPTAAPATSQPTAAATEAPAATQKPATEDVSVNEPSGEGESISIVWQGPQYGPCEPDAPIVQHINNLFNVTVIPYYIEAAQYTELMNLRFASGEVPDVFSSAGRTNFREWARQDLLAEVPESYIREKAPAIAAELDHWTAEFGVNIWNDSMINGINYGMADLNIDNTYPGVTIWRTDWLKNVGINKIPETLDEFEEALYKFAKEDPDQNGQDDTYGLSAAGLNNIYGITGFWYEHWIIKNGEMVFGAIQPEMKDVLSIFARWYQDGVLDPEFVTGENEGGYWAISHAFNNGRVGMTGHGSYYHWNYPRYEGDDTSWQNHGAFKELNPDGDYEFGVAALRDGKGGRGVGSIAGTGACVFGYHMENEPEKMDKIMEILNVLAVDYDLYVLTKYGFEGVHFEYSDVGEIVTFDEFSPIEVQAELGGSNLFQKWQSMFFYPRLMNWGPFLDATVNRTGRYFNALTDSLPSDPDYLEDLNTLRRTTYVDIIAGTKPVDDFDAFVEEWLRAGGQILTNEANEWYKNNN